MAQGDKAISQFDARRAVPHHWRAFGLYLIAPSTLVALMWGGIPWLDPTGYEGRMYGTFMTFAWCSGLLVWALGIVRRYRSQFNLRSLVILTAVIAVFLGMCRTVDPVIPTTVAAGALSVGPRGL